MNDAQLVTYGTAGAYPNADPYGNLYYLPIAFIAACKMAYEYYEMYQLKEEKSLQQAENDELKRDLEMSRQHQRVIEEDNEMIEILMEYIAEKEEQEKETVKALSEYIAEKEENALKQDESKETLMSNILWCIKGKEKTARDIVKELAPYYPQITKSDVNSYLYSLKVIGSVKQVTGEGSPIWTA